MYNPQLDTFVAVVENGSFAKAAQALFISTPAVIKKVNALEDRLGLKLLDRTAQGTTLSEVGEVFYEEAKRIIEESHEVLIRLQSMQQEKDGKVIRIGLGYMTSRELLRDVVSVAQREEPELKYRLVTFEMRPELHRHNLSRLGKDIDFFLVMYDPMRASTLNTLHLSYEPVCCAVSLQHPLAEKDRLTIQDLRGQTMICFRQGYNAFIDQFRNDMRSLYPEIHITSFRGSSTMGQVSYNSQGSRSTQVQGSRVPSTSQATVSFITVSRSRKKSVSCRGVKTPPRRTSGDASNRRTVPS